MLHFQGPKLAFQQMSSLSTSYVVLVGPSSAGPRWHNLTGIWHVSGQHSQAEDHWEWPVASKTCWAVSSTKSIILRCSFQFMAPLATPHELSILTCGIRDTRRPTILKPEKERITSKTKNKDTPHFLQQFLRGQIYGGQ